MGRKKAGKETGSKLLAAIGKTKKEQMDKLYPKSKPKSYPKIKSKGPYTRGNVMGKGDFDARRAVLGGTRQSLKKSLSEADKQAGVATAAIMGSAATGYALGKGWHKKVADAVTKDRKTTSHKDKAKRMASEAVKRQNKKKEKHHSK